MKDNARRLTKLQLRAEAGLITEAESDELAHLLLNDQEAFENYIADLQLQAGLAWRLSGLQQSSDYFDQELIAVDADAQPPAEGSSAWDMVVDQALALRRQHEIEDQANQKLAAQQAEDARERRFELRRHAEPAPVKRVIVIPQVLVWLGAAAVIGIAATVIYQMSPPATVPPAPPIAEQALPAEQPVEATPRPVEPGPPVYVARVNDSFDARWLGGAEPGRLEAGASLTLTSGIAEVALEGQASILVEGPASVEVVDAGTMRLVAGRVVANATSTAQPFKLLIDNTSLTGQGAVFGVNRLGTGQASTTVFAGSIDFSHAADVAAAPRRRIGSGQVAKLATDRGEIKTQARATQDDEANYNRSMAGTRLRPTHTTSSVQFLSTAPGSLVFGELADRDRVRLFCESAGRSVDAAGMRTVPADTITLGAVPLDKPADSYLLHMDPAGDDAQTVTTIVAPCWPRIRPCPPPHRFVLPRPTRRPHNRRTHPRPHLRSTHASTRCRPKWEPCGPSSKTGSERSQML